MVRSKVFTSEQPSKHLERLKRRRLRDLVPSAPDREESEVIDGIAHRVACHLGAVLVEPRMPGVGNVIPHALSPCLAISVRNARIPIAIVDHDADLGDEPRVGVTWQVGTRRSVLDLIAARRPFEWLLFDMCRFDDRVLVEVRRSGRAIDTCVRAMDAHFRDTTVDGNFVGGQARSQRVTVVGRDAIAINVVEIYVADSRAHLVRELLASVRWRGRAEVAGCSNLSLEVR
mmetsp:Transcript_8801/g.22992  ORF Transcript_8801/g.22992 Transcript_8801/m.22992 type:complete len:230 (+) Transcript_8801:139-828(+)